MKKMRDMICIMVVLMLAACKEQPIGVYNDQLRIQFGPDKTYIYSSSYNLADTLKTFTFYYEKPEVTLDTVFFDIYAIGGTSKTDRSFVLQQEQVAKVENAVAGIDYVPFEDAQANRNFVIKAGTVHTKVPILLLRSPALKNKNVTLKFKVVANENFKAGEVTNLWRKLVFTDRLSQPSKWDANATKYWLGSYSIVKHKFMIEATDKRWDNDFFTEILKDSSLLQYWLDILKIALTNYNLQHPNDPMKDENGEFVVIP